MERIHTGTHGRVLRAGNRLIENSQDAGWRSLHAAIIEEGPFTATEPAPNLLNSGRSHDAMGASWTSRDPAGVSARVDLPGGG
jgi:hypothetical protein